MRRVKCHYEDEAVSTARTLVIVAILLGGGDAGEGLGPGLTPEESQDPMGQSNGDEMRWGFLHAP